MPAVLCGLLLAATPLGASAYNQAPALASAGLPPVDKRLPDKPEVIKPLQRVGSYGGTLRTAIRASGDHNAILRLVGNQGLVRWSMDFNDVVPNVAESFSLNHDASEYTFRLRKGMKWSDGSPFTADDVLFSMNDVVGNREFLSNPPAAYVTNGKFAEVTKIDDHTVRFRFAGPYLGFGEALALPINQHATLYQKKYCGQFHPKYNPKVTEQFGNANVKDWASLMRIKCGDIEVPTRWGNPDKPTVDPWIIKEPYGGGVTRVVMERNPYFWQVDTAGNQLPYIDRLQINIISEVESIVLASINGQLDFQHRHIYAIQNRPVLAENQQKGGYKLMSFTPLGANSVGMYLNYSTKNATLRKYIRQRDFRVALSLATDRKEVNDIVFLGQGTPWQIGPAKESKWYNEKLGTQYTQYDLKTANELLDKLGLNKRDGNGYRLYPEGGRVSINAIASIQLAQQVESLELVRKQWAKAGVELVIQASERSLFYDRAMNNDYDLSADLVAGGLDITQNPRAILAVHPQESRQSLPWVQWYTSGGKSGEEPSDNMKKRLALYDRWKAAGNAAEADRLFKEILQLAADEFEVLGLVKPPRDPAIRNAKLVNVFESMPAGWSWPTPGPSLLQQWAFTK
ncbi:ABC transporter substrate-binding protein [Uliginosibacterium sp. H1]|uniref:ABC transporter substrate-binding protein n=1 Tax=Uliginosibacterium sp. H1 TaxID=3114757 RepID=UPI002E19C496|nr:ABC transporter substrate-binding protein [Uliginosibacterium sp. H1]